MEKETLIELKNVCKSFTYWEDRPDSIKRVLVQMAKGKLQSGARRRIEILKNVNFKIRAGEFVGIMGPNGVGKSTTLKVVAGIYQPTSGQVTLNGKIAPLLELGAGFAGELSGLENIYLNASILGYGRKRTEESLDEIMDFANLGEKIHMPVKNYSSGMVIRLGFSIAVHLDAPILLFDEILSVGDLGFQEKCLKKIETLHAEGRTIVLVSHDIEQVKKHCTRVILLGRDGVEFDGDVNAGAQRYQVLFAKAQAT